MRVVLVANRGEIAVRVIRACADAGLHSVAVYADPDADAPFVRLADEAYPLDGATAADTYLDIAKIVEAGKRSGADAVHPGYGFLSENAEFAQAVLDAGMTWIGPSPEAIRLLGDKVSARRVAARVNAPLVPGTKDPVDGPDEVIAFAEEHGLPVAIKAAFGGGGRGLKVARTKEEIPELFESATREAVSAFGRGECFVERYLDNPRHVEAQVLADKHGNVIVVGTRDCSLQRRHQKLVEEAPAPFLSDEQREQIHTSARAICRAADYCGAGTVEYLVGNDGTISFLEVNTRLQVEHPVSEETSGLDLVREMFAIAAGHTLPYREDPEAGGHAIEFRINAEDAGRGFLPAQGTITRLSFPDGPGIRVDSGVAEGSVIGGQFDSLLAKLVVTGTDREHALRRARRALAATTVDGLPTVLPFHRAVLEDPAFAGDFAVHTTWIETGFDNRIPPHGSTVDAALGENDVLVWVGGRELRVHLPGLDALGEAGEVIRERAARRRAARVREIAGDAVSAPMRGTIVRLGAADGDRVAAGDTLAVLEAMKMENPVTAHKDGVVGGLTVSVGDGVAEGAVLCEITDPGDVTT